MNILRKLGFIFSVFIVILFFYSVNREHILGYNKTGISLSIITFIILCIGFFAYFSVIYNRMILKMLTRRVISILLFMAVLLNIALYNKLKFQKLPTLKRLNDASLVEYNKAIKYSNHDYPIYFFINEKYSNSVVIANHMTLNKYGISTVLLKSWGGVRDIIEIEKYTELFNEFNMLPSDTLSIKGDTLYFAARNAPPYPNDTIFFIDRGAKFYITGRYW